VHECLCEHIGVQTDGVKAQLGRNAPFFLVCLSRPSLVVTVVSCLVVRTKREMARLNVNVSR
jgi:hypothetical protein